MKINKIEQIKKIRFYLHYLHSFSENISVKLPLSVLIEQ